jgi:hypothetical protein
LAKNGWQLIIKKNKNMKQLLSLFLLLLPCLALAQYPSNGNQKITLGEQSTADGLIYRGVLADTSIITPSSDTSAYIILDTVNHRFYNYNRATNVWSMAGVGSISSGLTGVLPVANGGTNRTTMPAGYILHGDGTAVDTAIGLFWDRTNFELGVGTNNPISQLNVYDETKDASIIISGTSAFNQNFYFFDSRQGITKVAGASQLDFKSIDRFVYKIGATAGSQTEEYRFNTVGIGVKLGGLNPTARLHLAQGTATASTAPLKFTSGTNLTTAEAGAMEFNGTNLLFTPSATRHTVNHGLTGSATLNFPSTTTLLSADLTIAVTGAADGDVVSLGVPNAAVNANTSYSAWVSSANTVTVRFNNYSSGTVDPASALFKVFVTK